MMGQILIFSITDSLNSDNAFKTLDITKNFLVSSAIWVFGLWFKHDSKGFKELRWNSWQNKFPHLWRFDENKNHQERKNKPNFVADSQKIMFSMTAKNTRRKSSEKLFHHIRKFFIRFSKSKELFRSEKFKFLGKTKIKTTLKKKYIMSK